MLIYSDWNLLGSDGKRDMIRYLKVLCALQMLEEHKARLLRQVCIPVLAYHDGEIVESMDTVNKIGNYGYDLTRVNEMLSDFHQELTVWVTAKKAAQFMKLSTGYVRSLARRGIPTLEAKRHPEGWRINLVSVIDYLLRTKRVQIA